MRETKYWQLPENSRDALWGNWRASGWVEGDSQALDWTGEFISAHPYHFISLAQDFYFGNPISHEQYELLVSSKIIPGNTIPQASQLSKSIVASAERAAIAQATKDAIRRTKKSPKPRKSPKRKSRVPRNARGAVALKGMVELARAHQNDDGTWDIFEWQGVQITPKSTNVDKRFVADYLNSFPGVQKVRWKV